MTLGGFEKPHSQKANFPSDIGIGRFGLALGRSGRVPWPTIGIGKRTLYITDS